MTQTVLLGDIVDHFKGLAFKSRDYQKLGVPIVRVCNFTIDSIDASNLEHVSKEVAELSSKVILETGDIVIATVGSWPNNPASVVGNTVKIPVIANGALLNQNAVALRHKSGDPIEQQFVYYCLKSPKFIDYLVGGAQGSANQASITLNSIFRYKINNFDYDVKKRIVESLSSIDEKIELSRQMNETLEQMGQALFRHYFIDNNETETVKVEDLLLFERGVEPGSKNYSSIYFENSSPFLRVGDLGQRKNNIFVDNELLKNKFVKFYEILVSFDGAPGLVAVGLEGSYSTGIRKVVIKDGRLSIGYAYFLMKSEGIQGTIERYSEGTTIKHAPRAIENMTAQKPNNSTGMIELQDILDVFINNLLQIQTLTTLRDTLLPRLISGKIKV